jgi:hypothetical protein
MFMRNNDAKAPTPQNLVRKYRPIGPAAIVAAVAAMRPRRNKPGTTAKRSGSISRVSTNR